MEPLLDELVASVLASAKYRAVCPDTVRRIGEQELAKGRGLKAAAKATKARLHQISGAFAEAPDYTRLLRSLVGHAARVPVHATRERGTERPLGRTALRSASDGLPVARVATFCRAALACHASTRERLPLLERFYGQVFAVTGQPRRVLDLACGLHPLAIPWMGLPPDTPYTAFDIDGRAVDFLNRCAPLLHPGLEARHADVLCSPPAEEADVAFLLKAATSLERQEKGALRRLLGALRVRHVVVSFPVASLGGRDKGMRENYERAFMDMVADGPWRVERLEFPTELVFVVRLFPA